MVPPRVPKAGDAERRKAELAADTRDEAPPQASAEDMAKWDQVCMYTCVEGPCFIKNQVSAPGGKVACGGICAHEPGREPGHNVSNIPSCQQCDASTLVTRAPAL